MNGKVTALLVAIFCMGNHCGWANGQATANQENAQPSGDHDGRLHVAARAGDPVEIRRLLDSGIDVNSKNRYKLTALYYAADRGHADAVKTLLEAGAEIEIPNEPFYRLNPLIMAARKNHAEVVRLLLDQGANCGSWTAMWPASLNHTEVVKVLVDMRPDVFKGATLNQLAGIAQENENEALLEYLLDKGADPELPDEAVAEVDPLSKEEQQAIDGIYESADESESTRIWARRGTLYLGEELELAAELTRISDTEFEMTGSQDVRIRFERPFGEELEILSQAVNENESREDLRRFSKLEVAPAAMASSVPNADSRGRWTRFRGEDAQGNADGMDLPWKFDATIGTGVAWKTPIPGVGHSSPVIWGDHVYLTSAEAITDDPEYDLRVASGFDTHVEDIDYRWTVFCVSLNSGEIIWQQKLDEGRPKAKRHVMSSHANCTPAVDDQHVIVNLAGQGIYCLDHQGQIQWKRDMGKLAAGWFMDPGYEWGFASSPVLHDGRVYVQCDVFQGAFIAALDASDGSDVWRTRRAEVSSWGTPLLIQPGDEQPLQVVANGTRAVCGYDASNGEELWRIEDNSEVTVASPIPNGNHVIVTGGYQPWRPIFSIDVTQRGNLTPPRESEPAPRPGLQWWLPRGGAYGITPIIYRDQLYILSSNGVLTTYDAATGDEIYKKRVVSGRSGDIVASPIAADGRIYIIGGDGDVFVLPAGPEYERPTVCPVGEQVMATPAAAPGRLIIRGINHLFCFSHGGDRGQ